MAFQGVRETATALQLVTHESLRAAREGDGPARNELFARLRPRLVLWAQTRLSRSLRARHDPEDVAQEILLALHRSVDSFEGDDPRAFRAWVFTIAENRIRDLADRAGALKRRTPEPRVASRTSPSEVASRAELGERVRAAIERLRADYRDVIRLRRLEERETAEVARILGRSSNAVRILYCRALAALRDELGEID
jgi:RNA polymerase sigma-70 factor (ECF subfamily)